MEQAGGYIRRMASDGGVSFLFFSTRKAASYLNHSGLNLLKLVVTHVCRIQERISRDLYTGRKTRGSNSRARSGSALYAGFVQLQVFLNP